MLERIKAMHVADKGLSRRQDGQQDDGRAQRLAAAFYCGALDQIPGRHGGHHKATGNKRGQREVRKAPTERGIENGLAPGGHLEVAVHQFDPGRCLHPAVGGENPERRNKSTDGHHKGGKQVHTRWHPMAPEQQDAEKRGFQEEGGHHFIAEHRAKEIRCGVGEDTPVGPELERHDDAGYHAHAEYDGEDLGPEMRQLFIDCLAGDEQPGFKKGDVRGEADGENGKDGVEGYHEGKLDT